MKKFVTIFEKTENIHLIKDVGQIPYLMHKYFNYDSKVITYKNEDTYDYLDNEVKGLKLDFIPKIKIGRYSFSILWYLYFNAKKIDVLHMFHHREKTYLNFLMYKWRNPKGIAFLKSDIGLNTIKEYNGLISDKRPKYVMRSWLFKKVLPKLDIVSIESNEGYNIVTNRYKEYKNKFLYMSNGINIEKMYSLVPSKKFEKKENIILTVGRIGAPEKNNELLLSAIESMDIKNYKFVFVGPIEKKFEKTIELFYKNNPHLKEKVIFTGAIYNRVELYEWYAKSKVFCLTSIEESFGFVLIEAMAYGNYIITTPISSAEEIIGDKRFGSIVKSKYELINKITKLIQNEKTIEEVQESIKTRVEKHYTWYSVLTLLNNYETTAR